MSENKVNTNILAALAKSSEEELAKETQQSDSVDLQQQEQQPVVEENPVVQQAEQKITEELVVDDEQSLEPAQSEPNTAFFLRRGTDLTIPILVDLPDQGRSEVNIIFENGTVSLAPFFAKAFRRELSRNAPLSQRVFEYDPTNPAAMAVVAHHTQNAVARNSGNSGLDATINNQTAGNDAFRDPSLYAAQPGGRFRDAQIAEQQATLG